MISTLDRHLAHSAGYSEDLWSRVVAAELTAVEPPSSVAVIGTPPLGVGTFAVVAETLYARYIGRANGGRALSKLSAIVTTLSADAVVYVGVAESTEPPVFTDATITVKKTALIDVTATGVTHADIDYLPTAGSHLWLVLLCASGTEPSVTGLSGEIGIGILQSNDAVTAIGEGMSFDMTPVVAGVESPLVLAQVAQ